MRAKITLLIHSLTVDSHEQKRNQSSLHLFRSRGIPQTSTKPTQSCRITKCSSVSRQLQQRSTCPSTLSVTLFLQQPTRNQLTVTPSVTTCNTIFTGAHAQHRVILNKGCSQTLHTRGPVYRQTTHVGLRSSIGPTSTYRQSSMWVTPLHHGTIAASTPKEATSTQGY